ncbi:MAG: rRNA maturation RNase YbeY, partial [Terriglobia bacterium]
MTSFQKRVVLRIAPLRAFVEQLHARLRLKNRWFEVALVDDVEISRLNQAFRDVAKPTDVLSFGWQSRPKDKSASGPAPRRLAGFLGIIVISAETARRNAGREKHSLQVEIRQLILHGILH